MNRPLTGNLLLVGEGDFSLTVALVSGLSPENHSNITSTSLETDLSIHKHKDAQQNISWLKDKGVGVYLSTDATKLHENELFKDQEFERIIFNFPHAGGKSNHKKNRKLLNDFFCSAAMILQDEGQIMMTLCKGQGGTPADNPMRKWHDSWQVVSMAANGGLILKEVLPFHVDDFYHYNCTGFRSQDKGFNTDGAIVHVFQKAPIIQIPEFNSDCSSAVPGQCYFEEKMKRKLHEEHGNPVQVIRQRLEEAFTQKYDGHVDFAENIWTDKPEDETLKLMHKRVAERGDNQTHLHNNTPTVQVPIRFSYFAVLQHQIESLIKIYAKSTLLLHTTSMVLKCPVIPDFLPVSHVLIGICDGYQIPQSVSSECSKGQGNVTLSSTNSLNITKTDEESKAACIGVKEFDGINVDKEDFLNTLSDIFKNKLLFTTEIYSCETNEFEIDDNSVESLYNISISSDNHQRSVIGQICSLHSSESRKLIFILNLDLMAVAFYKIPNVRLLWSQEKAVHQSFRLSTSSSESFRVTSLYPMKFTHDMSFWENPDQKFDESTFYDIIRDVAGDNVLSVSLIDTYECQEDGKISRCYRLEFQSFDKTLMYNASWKIQSVIRLAVAEIMKVTLR